MQPQQQPGSQPGGLGISLVSSSKEYFWNKSSERPLGQACGVPCMPIRVLGKLCLPVTQSSHTGARQVGTCPGPGLLRTSRPRLLLYLRYRRSTSPHPCDLLPHHLCTIPCQGFKSVLAAQPLLPLPSLANPSPLKNRTGIFLLDSLIQRLVWCGWIAQITNNANIFYLKQTKCSQLSGSLRNNY